MADLEMPGIEKMLEKASVERDYEAELLTLRDSVENSKSQKLVNAKVATQAEITTNFIDTNLVELENLAESDDAVAAFLEDFGSKFDSSMRDLLDKTIKGERISTEEAKSLFEASDSMSKALSGLKINLPTDVNEVLKSTSRLIGNEGLGREERRELLKQSQEYLKDNLTLLGSQNEDITAFLEIESETSNFTPEELEDVNNKMIKALSVSMGDITKPLLENLKGGKGSEKDNRSDLLLLQDYLNTSLSEQEKQSGTMLEVLSIDASSASFDDEMLNSLDKVYKELNEGDLSDRVARMRQVSTLDAIQDSLKASALTQEEFQDEFEGIMDKSGLVEEAKKKAEDFKATAKKGVFSMGLSALGLGGIDQALDISGMLGDNLNMDSIKAMPENLKSMSKSVTDIPGKLKGFGKSLTKTVGSMSGAAGGFMGKMSAMAGPALALTAALGVGVAIGTGINKLLTSWQSDLFGSQDEAAKKSQAVTVDKASQLTQNLVAANKSGDAGAIQEAKSKSAFSAAKGNTSQAGENAKRNIGETVGARSAAGGFYWGKSDEQVDNAIKEGRESYQTKNDDKYPTLNKKAVFTLEDEFFDKGLMPAYDDGKYKTLQEYGVAYEESFLKYVKENAKRFPVEQIISPPNLSTQTSKSQAVSDAGKDTLIPIDKKEESGQITQAKKGSELDTVGDTVTKLEDQALPVQNLEAADESKTTPEQSSGTTVINNNNSSSTTGGGNKDNPIGVHDADIGLMKMGAFA